MLSATPRFLQRSDSRRGSAVLEMAFMLPVLILMFVGMIEFGNFIMVRERVNKISNQLTNVLYNIRIDDLSYGDTIKDIMDQSAIIARPLEDPTVTVRFCQWQSGQLFRFNRQHHSGVAGAGCGDEGPQCSLGATQEGFGAFVQTYTCSNYNPLFLGPIFSVFNQQIHIKSLSYLPLMNSNTVQPIEELPGGGRVAEGANCNNDPVLCGKPQDYKNPCADIPGTEDVNGRCLSQCDTGYKRAGDQCNCPPSKIPNGNGGCMCPGTQHWDATLNQCVM